MTNQISTGDRRHLRVMCMSNNTGVRSGVWAVFEFAERKVTPMYWREEQMQ